MDLRQHRRQNRLTLSDIAELMGHDNPATVHRHETGLRKPDALTMDRYRKATGGNVTFEDWVRLGKRAKK